MIDILERIKIKTRGFNPL